MAVLREGVIVVVFVVLVAAVVIVVVQTFEKMHKHSQTSTTTLNPQHGLCGSSWRKEEARKEEEKGSWWVFHFLPRLLQHSFQLSFT